ncbi:hypothetical protein BOTNAR_0287g00160 [Botryotinia narcissicola]|uniref:NAD(P)-binding domain-containing protein n=1 Tax=Botryotinia narcissicola TaxID=278944 RepID=A0A4Z1HXG0_9HELO|nr:hypothetical protein BOTNAR_0287g00160 [Botryotinia narcissicola]
MHHQHEKLDSKMLKGLRFPTPESHDTIDLVKLVSDNVDRHVYDSRTALGIKENALECLTKRSDYATGSYFSEKAYDPSDHPGDLSLSYLFAIFNDLFFLGSLTYRTTVSRSEKATDSTYRTLRRHASPIINTLIEIPVHSSGRIDCDRPINIVVPFVKSFQSQIAGLLGAMIDLYIRYNSCVNSSCLGNIVIRGKMGRGQVWQLIAYNLEVSDTMRAMKEAIGMEIIPQIVESDILKIQRLLFQEHSSARYKSRSKTENNSCITSGFFLPLKAASSSGIFAAVTRIVHSSTPEIDHTKSPNIIIPFKGTSSTKSSPGDDVSALLEAMIAFYLQWYSCRKPSCLNKITACGMGPRGYAWQKIANLLEGSEMMSDMQTLIGSQVRLRRYEEFVRELSYWDKPRLLVSLDLLRELGLVAWTVEDFVYAAEEEQRKTLASANLAATIVVYFGSLTLYRLSLHPLAQFPGPRLASITRYYEAYYDIVQNVQYTFKIAEMHKKYGINSQTYHTSHITRTLRNRGVHFTQSDGDDMDALRNSVSGCEKLFLFLDPKLDDLDYEHRQAEKIVRVAKKVGIKQVVASASLGVSMLGTGIHITLNFFMAKHLAGKKGVEQAVIDANFKHWTFLRPAFSIANFLEPKEHRYPELRDRGTWITAITTKGKFALINHIDIVKVATAAF